MRRKVIFVFFLLLIGKFAIAVDTGGVGVVGGLRRENTCQPGNTYRGVIFVTNNGSKPAEVKVYQTDYTPLIGGCNYGEPGTSSRSNAKWIKITPSQFIIPENGKVEVFYTISVPDDQTLKGSYWSMIMVEPIQPISIEKPKVEKDQIGVGIVSVVRYGILMITHIADTGKKELRIVDKQLQEIKDKKYLVLTVENIGERILSCKVWAELYNNEGMSIGRFGQESDYGFYPGCKSQLKMDITNVPSGKYKTLVVLDAGGENVFGAQYDLEVQ